VLRARGNVLESILIAHSLSLTYATIHHGRVFPFAFQRLVAFQLLLMISRVSFGCFVKHHWKLASFAYVDICAQVYLGRWSTSLFFLSFVLCLLRVFLEMSTVQKRKMTNVVTNETLWYPEYHEFWDNAAKIQRTGLPCIVKVQNGDDQGGRITLELIPQEGWVHMSTEIGRREAPFPYHVSLCWTTDADVEDDVIEITKKWDKRAHVLNIDYMSRRACAFVSLEDALSEDYHVKKLRLLGTHGEALSISM
jgi:hypothetical protein